MMWSLKENRPMLWQEQFNAQGVPIFEHTMAAAGVPDSQIQLDLGHSNMVRLAGNGFHIACAGSFVGYVLSILEPNEGWACIRHAAVAVVFSCIVVGVGSAFYEARPSDLGMVIGKQPQKLWRFAKMWSLAHLPHLLVRGGGSCTLFFFDARLGCDWNTSARSLSALGCGRQCPVISDQWLRYHASVQVSTHDFPHLINKVNDNLEVKSVLVKRTWGQWLNKWRLCFRRHRKPMIALLRQYVVCARSPYPRHI